MTTLQCTPRRVNVPVPQALSLKPRNGVRLRNRIGEVKGELVV